MLFLRLVQELAPTGFVVMGDHHTVPVDDEAVPFPFDLEVGHDVLDMVHPHIQGEHVRPVGEHPADGDDHGVGLGVHIGGDDGGISVRLLRRQVPIPLQGVIALRRGPAHAVQVFPKHIAVDPGEILVKMLLLAV